MRIKKLCIVALAAVVLACALPAGVAAQTSSADTDKKIADLEKQLEAIRSELTALKAAPAAVAPATTAPAPATTAAVATPAPDPMAGITGVLGGVNLTALVDGYYGYNHNHPSGGTITEPFTTNDSQFSLNLIELQLDKPVDKTTPLGFRATFGFGNAMNAINGASNTAGDGTNSATQYLKEGYLSYFAPVGKGLQIDFGKFVTPAGVEVLETNQNWNYSRGLLFYDAYPYYHFGLRAKYTFNDKWNLTGFMTNGWNNVVATNSGKTGGLSIGWNATKKVTLIETYLTGPRDIAATGDNGPWNNLADTALTYSPTAKLSLAAGFDYDHEGLDKTTRALLGFPAKVSGIDYTGFAGYIKYAVTPKVNVAGRYEYLNDHDGMALGVNSGLLYSSFFPASKLFRDHPQEFTATLERTFAGNLISRLEYRHDNSNNKIFESGGGKGPASFVSGQDTVDVGLMFVLQPAAPAPAAPAAP